MNPQPVWALAGGGDNAYFNISSTGVLAFKAAPNYEMPRDMLPSVSNTPHYTVYVQMTDAAGNTSIVALNVTVQDVNEAPFVFSPVPTQNIIRGQAYRLDVHNSFRDPDAANTDQHAVDMLWGVLTYTTTNLPMGLQITENGIITGTASTYTATVVTVTATDGGGLSVTQTFNLNVVDGVKVQSFTVQDAGNGNGTQLGLRGEMLTFRLVLSEAVTVTGGTPTVTFTFNSTEHVTASYISGSGSDTLLFAGASAMAPSGDGNEIFLRAIDLGSAQVSGITTGLAWNSTLIGNYYDGYTVDNIPPHLPTLTLASDTGSSASDKVTNNATINVSGLDSGVTWQYQVDGTAGGWITGTGSSFTASTGAHSYLVRQIDAAGNTSTQSNAVTYTLDNSTPATPSLTLASDTGSNTSDGLTNNVTINVSGLETGATWQYQVDSSAWVDGTGSSFIANSAAHSYLVRQTDVAGNTSTQSNAVTYTLDTSAPATPGLTLASDTGSSASDGLTSNATINVSALETGATWQYQEDGSGSWITGSGASFTASNSTHTYWVRQIDAAGNTSATSTAVTYTLDNSTPTVNTTTFSVAENTTAVGTLVASEAVTWSLGSGADTGLFTLTNGVLSFTTAPNYEMPRGSAFNAAGNNDAYTVNVMATDAAGNTSVPSAIVVNVTDVNEAPIAVGTIAPRAATQHVAFSYDVSEFFSDPDTQASNAAWRTLTYSATGLPSGLTMDSSTGVISGTTNTTVTTSEVTVSATDGVNTPATHTFNLSVVNGVTVTGFTVTDSTGNANTGKSGGTLLFVVTMSESVTVTGIPTITFTINGQDVVASYTRNATHLEFTATAPAAEGHNISLKSINLNGGTVTATASASRHWDTSIVPQSYSGYTVDNTALAPSLTLASDTGTSASDRITNNVTINVGGLEHGATWQYQQDNSAWTTGTGSSFTASTGAHSYLVRQTDVAGNTSATSTAVTYTLDTREPDTPSLTLASDAGSSASDKLTNNVTINVGGLESGAIWQYQVDGSGSWMMGTASSFTASAGTHSYSVIQTDAAGNTSATSTTVTYTFDTTALAPSLTLANDAGSSTSDQLTNNVTINVGGLENGATWQYQEDSSGSWMMGTASSFTASTGTHTYWVRQTDAAGNTSIPSTAVTYTFDTSAPATPTLTLASDTGSSASDGLTSNPTINVGGLETGATWQYQEDSSGSWITGTASSFTASTGTHTYWVRQTDAAGNTSVMSTAVTYTFDTSVPVAPTLTPISDAGSSASDGLTSNVTINVGGLETGATWQYQVDGSGSWMTGTASSFTASIGAHSYWVRQTDAAGNTSVTSSTVTYTFDTSEPATPGLTLASDTGSSASDQLTNNVTINVGGLEAGATWQYQQDSSAWATGTASSFTASAGTHSYSVRQTDVAGNTSVMSTAVTYTFDTSVPVTPILTLASDTGSNASDRLTSNVTINVGGLENGATWQYQVDGTAGSWMTGTGTSFTATSDTHTYFVRQTDAAGNTSTPSNAITYTFDTSLPAIPNLTLASDAGSSASDRLTNNLTINVGGLKHGAMWQYQVDNGSWATGMASSFIASTGTHSYFVRQTDAAGNTSGTSTAVTYTFDTIAPTTSNIVLATAATTTPLNIGDVITARVTMSETVQVTGTPQLTLTIGSTTKQASYSGGTGTTILTFTYAVETGLFDGDGISIAANAIMLNGGTIQDNAGNTVPPTTTLVANVATLTVDTVNISLRAVKAGTDGFVLNGEANTGSGYRVATVGDINGDGFTDFMISGFGAPSIRGKSYVVFGKDNWSGISAVNLSAIAAGSGGFALNDEVAGSAFNRHSGSAVGDINGDGLADFIVGASDVNSSAGKSYVVFGRQNWSGVSTLNLSVIAAGSGGFALNAEAAGDANGYSVASAGDVNGDGYSDFIIGARNAIALAGKSYVVFGRPNWSGVSTLNLSVIAAGSGGFALNGETASDNSGWSVTTAGDINGDGFADLVIGAPNANLVVGADGYGYAGKSYVIFGRSNWSGVSTLNLSTIAAGSGGFALNGENYDDNSGFSVSAIGDINSDGYSDFIVNAGVTALSLAISKSYVVFGKANWSGVSTLNLSTIAAGTGGFVLVAETSGDKSGTSVAAIGDINGDGYADFIIGAIGANSSAGKSYVVFGRASWSGVSTLNLSLIAAGSGGFVVNGVAPDDNSGYSVSPAGDINGDGYADIIVGATTAMSAAGQSYIIFGGARFITSTLVQGSGTVTGTVADEAVVGSAGADVLTGGGGVDRFFGGAGNDTIVLTSSDIGNLVNVSIASVRATVDGGTGIDTLRLSDGANLNLTTITNIAAGAPTINSRIASIEGIDLATDSAANTLTLSVNDVLDMAGMNNFNTGNGWNNVGAGTALSASVQRHQLLIDGTVLDVLHLTERWILQSGQVTNSASGSVKTYKVYNSSSSTAQLLVDNNIQTQTFVQNISLVAAFGILGINHVVTATVTMDSAVNVNGTPQLRLTIGNQEVAANYASGSGSSTLIFTYTILARQFDTNGISIAANSLTLNGGAINTVASGLAAVLTHDKVADNARVLVDGVNIRLNELGNSGLLINGEAANDQSGYSVATAGDINGDGFADFIVSAPFANNSAGTSYVVFGKANWSGLTTLNLNTIAAGSGGFALYGEAIDDRSGVSVATMGDINGDGYSDFIIGAWGASSYAGKSYVVFGRSNWSGISAVNLSTVAAGSGGFVLTGERNDQGSGYKVSSAGDVNGDGYSDFMVTGNNYLNAIMNKSYVIFGRADWSGVSTLNLSTIGLGSGGFVLNSDIADLGIHYSIATTGDINGDGYADLIVGANSANSSAGKSYVVFGRASWSGVSALNLSTVAQGSGGFVVNGETANDNSGFNVAAAGDVNGDGYADFIIGAPGTTLPMVLNGGNNKPGKSYVVFGRASWGGVSALNLNTIAAGTGGFLLNGWLINDHSGFSVSRGRRHQC